MKFLYVFSMIFCTVYGFRFKDILSHHKDILPHSECAGQPNGVRLPHSDCGRFILCDGGAGLVLSCRGSEPNFDRCSQRCVNDPFVCTVTDCNGGGEVTPPPQTTATPTTVFTPPTVPQRCPDPCTPANTPPTCDCPERWTCISGTCQCDLNIQCPIPKDVCLVEPECGGEGGCADRCVCDENDMCLCDKTIECGFPQAQCAARCGCAANCNCDPDPANCVCREECACPSPPNVCPFPPSDCEARCLCDERCTCNGNVCMCDVEKFCPTPAYRIFMEKH